jgi:hypothetical protein
MKYFILLSALLMNSLPGYSQKIIQGKISNLYNSRDQIFKMVFLQAGKRLDSTVSGLAGAYKYQVAAGIYDIELSQAQSVPVVLKSVKLGQKDLQINFSAYFIPLTISRNGYERIKKYRYDDKRDLMLSDTNFIFDDNEKTYSKIDFGEIIISEESKRRVVYSSMSKTSSKYTSVKKNKSKGKRVKTSRKERKALKDLAAHPETSPARPMRASQVTAGRWRDIDHWRSWKNTINTLDISMFQLSWGFFPSRMMKLKVTDVDGEVLSFAKAELMDGEDKTLWEGSTDQEGMVYLWPDIFAKSLALPEKMKISQNGNIQIINRIGDYLNSTKSAVVDFKKKKTAWLEIGFIVDATGSMGDEIKFLQMELIDVITRVQKNNQCLKVRTGAVFYKDHGDDYLTRIHPLTSNLSSTVRFIGEQSANGGGDFPEALDVAMLSGLEELGWEKSDHPKIMFLLLDAPPHGDTATVKRIRDYTRRAAAQGIRIVPITASGIDKSTEFLMKFMAVTTNGEYVYITDDSKIGNAHLRPFGGESEISFLNDLLVNLINTYSKDNWCGIKSYHGQTTSSQIKDSLEDYHNENEEKAAEMIAGKSWHMTFAPNPAVDIVQLDFSEITERVRITDLNGRILFEKDNYNGQYLEIDVSSWLSGIYLVSAIRQSEHITGKLLVMH